MKKLYQQLLDYVQKNKSWTSNEENIAWENIDRWRCPLSSAAPGIYDEIKDLMSDFAFDNGLNEEVLDEFNAEQIFMDLE